MNNKKQSDSQPSQLEVSAVITAMTDKEQAFVQDTVKSVLSDLGIGQVILCIEESNTWIELVLGSLVKDSRLEIIQLPLAPSGSVRNQALNYVRMPWVAYCDGDDVWCKGKTLIQLNHAKASGYDFVGADHYLTNEKGEIRAFSPARYIPMPSSWLVKTEVMRQYPFNESLRQGEDGEWWVRTNGIIHKARCQKMLLRYRVRSGSLSTNTLSKRRKAQIVGLADIPVLGAIILFGTWCVWLCTRQDQYIWCKDWGTQHSKVLSIE